MARTAIDKSGPNAPYNGAWTELEFAAADVANGNAFTLTGQEILVIHNSSEDTPYHVTIDSTADRFKREGDITEVDIPFGEYHFFGPIPLEGWQQSDGMLYVDAENAAILFAVIKVR